MQQALIKNLEPLSPPKGWEKRRIQDFWEDATAAQKQVVNGFLRDYWLVDASRHKNQKVWFLYFERTVHCVVNDESKTCHVQRFTIWLDRTGKIKSYRRQPQEKVI
ncbi:hypothetical protein H6F43_03480 [Leptolyngbya sp. FACHB-36]|uniref:hypothetical protein n=1 Tax=Leptolyngbya sp. FACHB-36 TaxID=2692808 RepID=UPI00168110D5|nr:hypothetical protein [Leptolyngbya sp. FACHB-36]MBD2019243.1 hypothetical protein [Leptolyngbya sp. FACHB-36]